MIYDIANYWRTMEQDAVKLTRSRRAGLYSDYLEIENTSVRDTNLFYNSSMYINCRRTYHQNVLWE